MDDISRYIKNCEPALHTTLYQLRQTILQVSPLIQEKIAWGVPTYMYHGFLVQFAVNKKHIGFYCSPQAILHFQDELSHYHTNKKNTIHFPFNQALPLLLIQNIVKYRMQENTQTTQEKS